MIDRDKVIDGLKELCEYLFHEYKVCYHGDVEDTYNRFLIANNALELLKEQKPITPTVNEFGKAYCGNCGENVGIFGKTLNVCVRMRYCPECGKAVKWDE